MSAMTDKNTEVTFSVHIYTQITKHAYKVDYEKGRKGKK